MHPEHPMRDGAPPEWATGYGVDRYGPWAEFSVGGVVQRMRWVPPGVFTMGSPEGEAGRYDDEVQHEVRLKLGYWMADTPVTQALWVAVMGENPSHFVSPERPVEQVSWEDARRFVDALNERVDEIEVQLPTEAQWECACRAGTTTATYAGGMEILGANHAPVLDDIAWYGGNGGVEFELGDGEDSSGWSEKQHPHTKAGSHRVGLKSPNGLGLHDMLGNVWEWCSDWYAEYDADAEDPIGPEAGAVRVYRGGSWGDTAWRVRAAYRDGGAPGNRGRDLGFRLSRGPALSAGSAGGAPVSADRFPPWNGGPGVSGRAAVPPAHHGYSAVAQPASPQSATPSIVLADCIGGVYRRLSFAQAELVGAVLVNDGSIGWVGEFQSNAHTSAVLALGPGRSRGALGRVRTAELAEAVRLDYGSTYGVSVSESNEDGADLVIALSSAASDAHVAVKYAPSVSKAYAAAEILPSLFPRLVRGEILSGLTLQFTIKVRDPQVSDRGLWLGQAVGGTVRLTEGYDTIRVRFQEGFAEVEFELPTHWLEAGDFVEVSPMPATDGIVAKLERDPATGTFKRAREMRTQLRWLPSKAE